MAEPDNTFKSVVIARADVGVFDAYFDGVAVCSSPFYAADNFILVVFDARRRIFFSVRPTKSQETVYLFVFYYAARLYAADNRRYKIVVRRAVNTQTKLDRKSVV